MSTKVRLYDDVALEWGDVVVEPVLNNHINKKASASDSGHVKIDETTIVTDSEDKIKVADSIIQSINTKVTSVQGKQLSTEDFSTVEKTKLSNIAENANNYVHPETHPASIITGLSTVAISGNYNDLTNKPTLGDASVKEVGNEPGNLVELNSQGLIDTSLLPASSCGGVSITVSSTAPENPNISDFWYEIES